MSNLSPLAEIDNYNFNGGNITGFAGLPILVNFMQNNHLTDGLNHIPFKDDRKIRQGTVSNSSLMLGRIIQNFIGEFHSSQRSDLRKDPIMSSEFIKSQSTESRLYSRATPATNYALRELIETAAADFVNKKHILPVLDCDSTNVETFGKQPGSSYIHHYKTVGYHPINVSEYHTKLWLGSLLRSGDSHSANGTIQFLAPILNKLKSESLVFRGDAAFYSDEIISYLEGESRKDLDINAHGKTITYYVRAKNTQKLVETIFDLYYECGINLYGLDEKTYRGELCYQMSGSKKSRRILYEITPNYDKNGQLGFIPHVFCVVTNDWDCSVESGLAMYRQRGGSENFNSELKSDFGAGNLSRATFDANEFEYMLAVLSYNIFHMFQFCVIPAHEKKYEAERKMRMEQFRSKFIRVAAKIVSHAKKVTMSISTGYIYKEKFAKLYNNSMTVLV